VSERISKTRWTIFWGKMPWKTSTGAFARR